MESQLILSFIGASVLLSLMPGPDNIFVLTESVTKGSKTGVAISIGLVIGVLVHTLAAATGLSIIIQQSTMVFSVIKYLGAAYLFYLAYGAWMEDRPVLRFDHDKDISPFNFGYLIRKGFIMNVLNPKVSLFFIAFLPQFVSPDGMSVAWQMIILGVLFMIQALGVFSLISILSGKLEPYLNSPKFWTITKWSKITVLSGLAVALLFARK